MTGCTEGLESAIDSLGGALVEAIEKTTEAISGVADEIQNVREG